LWSSKVTSKANTKKSNNQTNPREEEKRRGPGSYNITRLYSIIENKEKKHKRFASIPNVERLIMGTISKVR